MVQWTEIIPPNNHGYVWTPQFLHFLLLLLLMRSTSDSQGLRQRSTARVLTTDLSNPALTTKWLKRRWPRLTWPIYISGFP